MTTLTRSDFGQQYLVRMDAFVLLRRRASSTQIVQTSSGSQLSLSNCFWLRSILAQDISSTSWSPPGGPHNEAAQAGLHIRLQALQEDAIT